MPKPFEAEQKCFEELMISDGRCAYAIPLYQRRYVWKTEENRKLWEDVAECFSSKSNHFLGSFVLMDYEKDPYDPKYQADELVEQSYSVRHVVDGQQRMTSLALILAALYQDMLSQNDLFASLPDKDSQDEQDWTTLQSKMRSCLVTDVRDRQSKTKRGYIPHLIPVKSTYEAYKTIVNQEEGRGKKLLIEKAYDFHLSNVAALRESLLPDASAALDGGAPLTANKLFDFYNQMFISIANRMKIIRIDCSAEEDAFQVFESLNGTGVRLTSADRIKNLLMGRGSREMPTVSISKIESEWQKLGQLVGQSSNIESFLTSYMFTVANRRVSKKELVRVFTDKYLHRFEGNGVLEAFKDLERAASHYGTIVSGLCYIDAEGNQRNLDSKLESVLSGIRKTNPAQSVVPLLAASLQYGFDDSRFKDIADRLLVLLVRHKVCQKSTNMLDRYFETICKSIKENNVQEVLNELKRYQQPDQTFASSFESMTFDTDKASECARARFYLESIENHLRNLSGDCNLDGLEELTLEHIIPQTFDPESWFANQPEKIPPFQGEDAEREIEQFETETLNSIGNMCLLRRPENSSASNNCFADKVERYQQPDQDGKTAANTFRLVRQIVDRAMPMDSSQVSLVDEGMTFDSESVARRAKALASYALKIWS